jgi:hypothetical protein
MSRKKNTPPPIDVAAAQRGDPVITEQEQLAGRDEPEHPKSDPTEAELRGALPALRVVTRRALSKGAVRAEGDRPDRAQLLGLMFSSACIVCTVGDIGDPTFRLWMVQHIGTRITAGGKFTLEIV